MTEEKPTAPALPLPKPADMRITAEPLQSRIAPILSIPFEVGFVPNTEASAPIRRALNWILSDCTNAKPARFEAPDAWGKPATDGVAEWLVYFGDLADKLESGALVAESIDLKRSRVSRSLAFDMTLIVK